MLVTGLRTRPTAPLQQEVPLAVSPPPPPPPPPQEETTSTDQRPQVSRVSTPEILPPTGTIGNDGRGTTNDQNETANQEETTAACAETQRGKMDATRESESGSRLVMVVNCHLTGGPAPERRMRQVFDGLDSARKEATRVLSEQAVAVAGAAGARGGVNKKKGKKMGGGGGQGGVAAAAAEAARSVPVVVCGDFNSNGRTAVCKLLVEGVVEASYREKNYPEVSSILFLPFCFVPVPFFFSVVVKTFPLDVTCRIDSPCTARTKSQVGTTQTISCWDRFAGFAGLRCFAS